MSTDRAAETFVPSSIVLETRFLLPGEVFEDGEATYRVTGQPFKQLGTLLRYVDAIDERGRRTDRNLPIAVEPGDFVQVLGRYVPGEAPRPWSERDCQHRPDDDPEPGDRCKDCGASITWIGPGFDDWDDACDG